MEFSKLLKKLIKSQFGAEEHTVPQHIQAAVAKMDITIARMEKKGNLHLLRTDYLE
ncbi:hypothetical protein [Acinetobacter sp. NCu2D-2]|uniref:hypothetical protein n=1 Tax=Acinetobacter sp. NCu2D-2 TaxID=1608473 RepID=UPI000A9E3FFB|nr:hypothetical protein [Acinetobacter sp. NCu2D-2]